MSPLPLATLSPNGLLILAFFAIISLILLIAKFRLNAILSLVLVSLLLGLAAGMDPLKVADAFKEGLASTLGSLAMIIGLGTMLGKLLAESGGAHVVANGVVKFFGVKRLDYAVMIAAFVVGVSVFFQVGLLLLGPIAFALARETKTPILRIGLPLAAGLSTAHGLIPPHPGPMAAISILGADVGKTIMWSLFVVGPPVALVTGPLLARWVTPRVPVELGGLGASATSVPSAPHAPSFGISLFTILLPVILMLVATIAERTLPSAAEAHRLRLLYEVQQTGVADQAGPTAAHIDESEVLRAERLAPLNTWISLVGNPTVAMLIAVLVSFWTFGRNCGLDAGSIGKFAEASLAPAASVLLVIAAGGGFSKVLNASGVGEEPFHPLIPLTCGSVQTRGSGDDAKGAHEVVAGGLEILTAKSSNQAVEDRATGATVDQGVVARIGRIQTTGSFRVMQATGNNIRWISGIDRASIIQPLSDTINRLRKPRGDGIDWGSDQAGLAPTWRLFQN